MISEPLLIWEKYQQHFCNDLDYRIQQMHGVPLVLAYPKYDYGLFLLGLGLQDQQRSLTDANLPENTFDWSAAHASLNRSVEVAHSRELATTMQGQLNSDQKACFDTNYSCCYRPSRISPLLFTGPWWYGEDLSIYSTMPLLSGSKQKRPLRCINRHCGPVTS